MNHMRVLKTLTLVSCLVQSFVSPTKGKCVFLKEIFTKTSNAGRVWSGMYKTRQVQSCGECASMCMRERVSPWMCGAYNCLPSELSCDLHSLEARKTDVNIVDLYLFQVTDVFHPMLINGHIYSIYQSSALKTYQDAKTHCENMESHLFYFDSLDDYEAIMMIYFGSPFDASFVGAFRKKVEGTWLSARDETAIDTSVWLWGDKEPSDLIADEDCAAIHYFSGFKLGSVVCTTPLRFLCKRGGD